MTARHDTGAGSTDDLRELAQIGARSASAALSHLLGAAVGARPPRLHATPAAPRVGGREDWRAAVLFETWGDRDGLVAIALTARGLDAAARAFLGQEAAEADSGSLREALCELGNIVASHTVSAVANAIDARILPSVPRLVMAGEEPSLVACLDQRREAGARIRIETFLEIDGQVGALLIWLPDSRKSE